jgi:mannose-6-phosphate isomerase-like protein (cupin superfamily)
MKETRKTENATSVGRRYYHPGQKDYATFLETSEETGGERTLIEIELAPGGGNTPHYHKTYDEHFEVLEGALEVQLGKASRILRPGAKAEGRLPGVFAVIEPLFRLLAKRARRKGIDKELEARYCR